MKQITLETAKLTKKVKKLQWDLRKEILKEQQQYF